MNTATLIPSSLAFANACERVDAACAAFLRKADPHAGRFNREKAGEPILKAHRQLAAAGVDALWRHLLAIGGFDRLSLYAAGKAKKVDKALDEADIRIVQDLLQSFGWPADQLPAIAAQLTEENLPAIYEAAASFALGRINAGSTEFLLTNEAVRDFLFSRSDDAVHSHRRGVEDAMQTIVRQFLERGATPHDPDFLEALRQDLDSDATWKARRFALTETGIASESAQHDVYARSGVEKKTWQTFEDELVRDSHEALDGKTIPMLERWDVGGHEADHPMDPDLPAGELVNCRCWEEPELDGKTIDEDAMWRGE